MKNITAGTIARTIVLIIALINQMMLLLGKQIIDISDDNIYEVISILFTIGASAAAWWKNNSFTENAIEADNYLGELKSVSSTPPSNEESEK